ncbi:hypothetical protein [Nocardia sp. NPDC004860]|uniref:hypothetical protein n=1 Tax=Nocardia sp. NPDC004860 TaxID=3154557 RepID=UPI0033AC086D
MGLALEEIVAAAEVLFAGRLDLIDSVRRAAAGLPGEDLEIPTSEWEELAHYELNHWLSEPVPAPIPAARYGMCPRRRRLIPHRQ